MFKWGNLLKLILIKTMVGKYYAKFYDPQADLPLVTTKHLNRQQCWVGIKRRRKRKLLARKH